MTSLFVIVGKGIAKKELIGLKRLINRLIAIIIATYTIHEPTQLHNCYSLNLNALKALRYETIYYPIPTLFSTSDPNQL